MKSITTFNTKQEIDNYINTVDMLAHAVDEEEVYLTPSKGEYRYVISAWFTPTQNKNMTIIGSNGWNQSAGSPIAQIAKVKITDLTEETTVTQTPTYTIPVTKDHIYRIDYGIYKNLDDNTWHAPTYLFGYFTYELAYYVAYPEVTKHETNFIYGINNLKGGIFKSDSSDLAELISEVDNYFLDNTQIPSKVNINNAVYEGHMTSVNGGILSGCNYVQDVYFDENIISIGSVFYNAKQDPTPYPSIIYIGSQVQKVDFPHQFKIRKVIIPEENPYIKWDETIRSVVEKTLVNGKIPIHTGGGVWDNDYLYIPSGYVCVDGGGHTYTTFTGRNTKIVNLIDYDGGAPTGFKDAGEIQTLILPRTTTKIGVYFNGLNKIKNFIIPCTTAPLVQWYKDAAESHWNGGWGWRGDQYGYSIIGAGNMYGYSLGWRVDASTVAQDADFTIPKPNRNVYVLAGTQDEQNSWTERYDRADQVMSNSEKNQWMINNQYSRDNIWHDITLQVLDSNGNIIQEALNEIESQPNKTNDSYNLAFRQYHLNYLTDQQMTDLINNLIPN